MGLTQLDFTGRNKIETAIVLIQAWEPTDGYHLAFSGGKDSVVLQRLADMAGVKYDLVYNRTGIDPPELVQFIRANFPQIIITKPKYSVWEGVQVNGLPRRQARWCCKLLKEYSGKDRVLLTGIRAAESARRRQRCIVEAGRKDGKTYIHPMFLWDNAEVWEFIHSQKVPYCSLYDEGWKRLGCVLCPMTSPHDTLRQWQRWPKLAEAWFRAATRYWEKKRLSALKQFETPEAFIWWWITRGKVSVEAMQYKAEQMGLRLH